MKRLVAFLTIGFCLLFATPAGAQQVSGAPTASASYAGCSGGITVEATGDESATLTIYLMQSGALVLSSGTVALPALQADPPPAGWTYTAPSTYVWNFPYGSLPAVPDGTYDVEVYVTETADSPGVTAESKFSADVLATCVMTTTTAPATTTTIAATTTTAAAAATSTTPTTVTVNVGAGELPFTGINAGHLAAAACALIFAGGILYLGARTAKTN